MRNGNLIELSGVVKTYQTEAGSVDVLKGIKLEIGKGEFVAVIGKSGSGKSTLINMITGIDRPSLGDIYIADTPIHTLSEGEVAKWRGKNLGIVFQFFQLLPTLTVIENIMLPMDFCHMYTPAQRVKRAMELLTLVELADHAHKLPSQLSGGQQQRVAIARALANDPPILVADEPTGNLDSKTAEKIFNLFDDLVKRGKTILVVTHDEDQAKRVKRTIVLSDGEIIEQYLSHTFPALTDRELIWATSKIATKIFKPGETIVSKGEMIDNFYIITKGHVEIVLHTASDHELVVAQFGKGQYFGEIELLEGSHSVATVRTAGTEEVQLACLPKKDFEKLLDQSHSTKHTITQVAKKRLAENIATSS